MKRNLFNKFAIILPAVWILASFSQTDTGNAGANKVIGILTTLSGKSLQLGKQLEMGARLAIDEMMRQSSNVPVRLEVRDSACDAADATNSAKQLMQLDVKIVIGPLCSQAMYAALEVLSPAGVPVIAPYIRASRLDQGRKINAWLAYTLASSAKSESENISRILTKRWQGKAYAIVDDGSVYGRGIADEFRILAEASGQKPVVVANFRPLQSTQIAMLRRLAKSNIEALFVGGEAEDIAQIAKDTVKLGLDIEIAGGESLIMLPYMEGANTVPDGILAVLPFEPARIPASAELVARLRQAGIEPDGALLAGYALTQIAAEAVTSGNLKLEGQKFTTIMGTITFAENGRAGAYSYQLHVWRDQQLTPIGGF